MISEAIMVLLAAQKYAKKLILPGANKLSLISLLFPGKR